MVCLIIFAGIVHKERTLPIEHHTLKLKEELAVRTRTETAIEESERRNRSFLKHLKGIVFKAHLDFAPILFQGAVEELTGYREEEFIAGTPRWDQVIHKDDLPRTNTLEIASIPDYAVDREYRIIRQDGKTRWVREIAQNVCDESGAPGFLQGMIYDITERKQAEEELRNYQENLENLVWERTEELVRANEMLHREIVERKLIREALQTTDEQLEAIIEFLPDATYVVDRNKRVIAWNRAIAEMTGVGKEKILGRGDHAYSIPFHGKSQRMLIDLLMGSGQDLPEHYDFIERKGNTIFGEVNVTMTCDGRNACLWATASLLYDRKGTLLGAIESIRDITERNHARDALLRSERQLRELSSQLISAQEEERKRISRDLHDSIGQSLAALKFNVESVQQTMLRGENEFALKSLGGLVPKIQQVIEEARRIYMGLRPSVLDDLGIIVTIGWCCREFQKTYPETAIETHIGIREDEVSEALKIVIFRIIQEALNNISKHSGAKQVSLSLMRTPTALELSISDDGVGFDTQFPVDGEVHSRGLGINGMRERAELSGGTFAITSMIGKGTAVRAAWPLTRDDVECGN